MSRTTSSAFLSAAAVIGIVGCLAAAVTPVVANASAAFTGSVATSGVVGVVFAARNAQLLRNRGTVSLPAAVLTTIFGGWFMIAPLLYDVGFLATAGTQLFGMLVSAFALYMTVDAIGGAEAPR
ncbi:hypothetical protein [Haloplanus sp.]|uniref:hypothetical protein n=1 Tax=Haloplanus sp. TaxID=1961696 RepID=UPI00261C35A3|nr:hypothetical protein [Haloplanus sp.]